MGTPPVPGGFWIQARRGPAGYPEKWAVVPLDAEPGEVVEDAAGGFVGGAGLVGVFDADHEAAALAGLAAAGLVLEFGALGEGPAEEGGASAADVEVAGGGGGEAGDDGGGGHGERW